MKLNNAKLHSGTAIAAGVLTVLGAVLSIISTIENAVYGFLGDYLLQYWGEISLVLWLVGHFVVKSIVPCVIAILLFTRRKSVVLGVMFLLSVQTSGFISMLCSMFEVRYTFGVSDLLASFFYQLLALDCFRVFDRKPRIPRILMLLLPATLLFLRFYSFVSQLNMIGIEAYQFLVSMVLGSAPLLIGMAFYLQKERKPLCPNCGNAMDGGVCSICGNSQTSA